MEGLALVEEQALSREGRDEHPLVGRGTLCHGAPRL